MSIALLDPSRPSVGPSPLKISPQETNTAATALVLPFCNNMPRRSHANVLVVINDASDASKTIGEHYVKKRSILPANVSHHDRR